MVGLLAVARDRGPAALFGLAAVVAVPAVLLATDTGTAALALGGSAGGAAAARWRPGTDDYDSRAERVAVNVGGLSFVGGTIGVAGAPGMLLPVAAAANAVFVFGIVAVPSLIDRFDAFEPVDPHR
jgi:hypothetical protein